MTAMKDDKYHWFALQTVPGIGAVRCVSLARRFGSAEAVLKATGRELKTLPDVGDKLTQALQGGVDYEEAARQREALARHEARMVTILDDDYPELLKRIYDPPPYLLVKGQLPPSDSLAVAIVGSRACTNYGRQITEKLALSLSEQGLVVVSGLARGIDSVAHRGTLLAGGHTVAVLGCGLDVIYPPENRELYEQIAASGAIVSEFMFGVKPDKYNFPSRNRIISGLCQGVIIVEAGRSSGALLTAKHALDQNREVFAVPGNISSAASFGANELIKQGAIPVTATADVLLALGIDPRSRGTKRPRPNLDGLKAGERNVFDQLSDQPLQVDRLSELLQRPVAEVLASLSSLEMAGLVRQLPGKLFLRQS